LSSLLGPIKDFSRPLRIKGDFELQKRIPTDRVSGFVSASLCLCMPNPLMPDHINNTRSCKTADVAEESFRLKLASEFAELHSVNSKYSDPIEELIAADSTESKIKIASSLQSEDLNRSISLEDVDYFASNHSSQYPSLIPAASMVVSDALVRKGPILSSRLSQRINKVKESTLKKKGNLRFSQEGDNQASLISYSTDRGMETGSSLISDLKKQRAHNRSGASSRMENVSKDLECLELSLQTIANAVIGTIARKIEVAESFAKEKIEVVSDEENKQLSEKLSLVLQDSKEFPEVFPQVEGMAPQCDQTLFSKKFDCSNSQSPEHFANQEDSRSNKVDTSIAGTENIEDEQEEYLLILPTAR
jgi:hypothetical protein